MLSYHFSDNPVGAYGLNYGALVEDYWKFRRMTNAEFVDHALDALHFACLVCWLKETGSEVLCDIGVVHELVHVLDLRTRPDVNIARLRMDFNQVCELA